MARCMLCPGTDDVGDVHDHLSSRHRDNLVEGFLVVLVDGEFTVLTLEQGAEYFLSSWQRRMEEHMTDLTGAVADLATAVQAHSAAQASAAARIETHLTTLETQLAAALADDAAAAAAVAGIRAQIGVISDSTAALNAMDPDNPTPPPPPDVPPPDGGTTTPPPDVPPVTPPDVPPDGGGTTTPPPDGGTPPDVPPSTDTPSI